MYFLYRSGPYLTIGSELQLLNHALSLVFSTPDLAYAGIHKTKKNEDFL